MGIRPLQAAFTLFLKITRFQSPSSLVDSRVNDILLQTFPDINEALFQLINVVQTTFLHSLLHDSPYEPYLIVYRIKVWAVGQPGVGLMKSGVFSCVAAHSEICEFSCYVFSKVR